MNREQFIAAFRHEFGGMILDAAMSGRRGPELSVALRGTMQSVDRLLGQAYEAAVKPPAPAQPPAQPVTQPPARANGQAVHR